MFFLVKVTKSTKRSTILIYEKHTREMPERKNIHSYLYATLKGSSLQPYIFNMTNLCQEQKENMEGINYCLLSSKQENYGNIS
jgi:hypothetical protein